MNHEMHIALFLLKKLVDVLNQATEILPQDDCHG